MASKRRPSVERALPTGGFEAGLLASPGYLLARIGAESRRLWTRMLAQQGLTPHQFGAILALGNLGNASQKDLSGFLGIDPRNSMVLFDSLERRELIARTADPDDRRRHAVRLTASGRRKLHELRAIGKQIEEELLSALDADERGRLHQLLIKLLRSATT